MAEEATVEAGLTPVQAGEELSKLEGQHVTIIADGKEADHG